MNGEMVVAVITQVNGLSAIVGELVRAGTADSDGRVGSCGNWAISFQSMGFLTEREHVPTPHL